MTGWIPNPSWFEIIGNGDTSHSAFFFYPLSRSWSNHHCASASGSKRRFFRFSASRSTIHYNNPLDTFGFTQPSLNRGGLALYLLHGLGNTCIKSLMSQKSQGPNTFILRLPFSVEVINNKSMPDEAFWYLFSRVVGWTKHFLQARCLLLGLPPQWCSASEGWPHWMKHDRGRSWWVLMHQEEVT